MERVTVTTRDGGEYGLIKYDGMFWPLLMPDPVGRARLIQGLEGEDGDVVLCTYSKSGTNWTWDMLMMLKKNKAELDITSLEKFELEFSTDFEYLRAQPSPRSFLTHMPVNRFSDSMLKKGKIVLVCRNPKDNAVSMFHHMKKLKKGAFNGDWDEYLQLVVTGHLPFGTFFDYYRGWDRAMKEHPEYKILLVYYEDFHRDSVGTLRKMCDFLGYDRSDDFLQAVTTNCQLETVRATKNADPALKDFIARISNDGQLPFYRKGIVGDWKTHFTVAQSEMFDALIQEKLKDTIYTFQWEMPVPST